jgi:phosphatidylinositol-3-phosphatase
MGLAGPPAFDHVVILIEENKGFGQIIGSGSGGAAPYINLLASQGALFTNYYAHYHPSQPNYIELFAGSNLGIEDDNRPSDLPLTAPNLGAELLAVGKTVASYSEDLPFVGWDLADSFGNYVRRHNPIPNWTSASPSVNQLPLATSRPFSGVGNFPANNSGDFSSLPTVSIIIPNLQNDMHDGTIAMGDTWLQGNVSGYITWAKTHNSLFVLTFDEDGYDENQHIATIFIGANVVPGTYNEPLSHLNLLRTMEDMYGTTHAASAATAAPIRDAFDTRPITWLNSRSGSWSDGAKWSGGAAPNGAGKGAVINAPTQDGLTIALDAPATIGTLRLGNSANCAVGCTLSGSGTRTLTFNNSRNDATITVTDGRHVINAPVVLANNLVVLGSTDTNSWTLSFGTASSIAGGFGLTMSGAGGALVLNGLNSYSGGTTITAGTLQVGSGGTSGSLIGNIANIATLVFNRSDNVTFGGLISGSGGLVKTGAGLLTLSGNNPYNGTTTVSEGTLGLVAGGSINASRSLSIGPAGTLLVNAGSSGQLPDAGSLALDSGTLYYAANGSLSAGEIAGALVFAPGHSQVIASNSGGGAPYLRFASGTAHMIGATVRFTVSGSKIGFLSNAPALSNGILPYAYYGPGISAALDFATLSTSAGVTLIAALTYSASTSGNVGLMGPDSTLNVMAAGSESVLAKPNAFNSLKLVGPASLTMTGAGSLTLNSGGLICTGSPSTISGGAIWAPPGEMIVNTASDLTITSVLSTSAAFVKTGTATLTLTATYPIDGNTFINQGALIYAPVGNVNYRHTISGAGSLEMSGKGILILSGSNSYTGGTTVTAGTLEITNPAALPEGGRLTIGTNAFSAFGLAMAVETAADAPLVVPEPSTLSLLGVGAISLAALWRQRRTLPCPDSRRCDLPRARCCKGPLDRPAERCGPIRRDASRFRRSRSPQRSPRSAPRSQAVLLDKQHLLIGGQRPMIVCHDTLELVGGLADRVHRGQDFAAVVLGLVQ